jgi:hypothetical protein
MFEAMSNGREDEIAANRMLADPQVVRGQLAADLAEIAAMGRGGVQVDPAAGSPMVAEVVRANADRLAFRSPVEAATLSLRRLRELPVAERGTGSPIGPYHAAASATVAHGELRSASRGRLVFDRVAAEVAHTTVTLQGVVEVDADGSVWLEAFGWPAEPDGVPVWVFGGAAEEYLAQAVTDARSGMPFDRVMSMVLGTASAWPGPVGTEAQRIELAESVATRRGELAAYVSNTESYALAVRAHGPFAACLYRSALETLFEGFLGSAAVSLVDMDEIEEIDDELRDVVAEVGPVPPGAVPTGIPSHHWWWHPTSS